MYLPWVLLVLMQKPCTVLLLVIVVCDQIFFVANKTTCSIQMSVVIKIYYKDDFFKILTYCTCIYIVKL